MSRSSLQIRAEFTADRDAVLAVNRAAFRGDIESGIIERLTADGEVLLSLVAVASERIVGHILFSPLTIETGAGAIAAAALAPLAVLPDWQRRGIGTALVTRGLAECQARKVPGVVVLGDPAYYGRFGFRADMAAAFRAPWSGPHLLAIELIPGGLGDRTGTLRYAAAFAALS